MDRGSAGGHTDFLPRCGARSHGVLRTLFAVRTDRRNTRPGNGRMEVGGGFFCLHDRPRLAHGRGGLSRRQPTRMNFDAVLIGAIVGVAAG